MELCLMVQMPCDLLLRLWQRLGEMLILTKNVVKVTEISVTSYGMPRVLF